MAFLTDVNIMIALLDRNHEHHSMTVTWFLDAGRHNWLTSPTIENGVIRIMSRTGYQVDRLSPADVAGNLRSVMEATNHMYIHDDVSLTSDARIDLTRMRTGSHVTDTYLLALAVAHDLTLVTLDRRIDASVVTGGASHLLVIE